MARIPFERTRFGIVDDNVHIRRLLRTILYSFGSRDIFEAEDGAAGLELIDLHVPDVVILDLVMPVFDGFDFMQVVRNPGACKISKVPIIMLTGHAEKKNVLKARELGVTEFMCKPFSADTLYKRISAIFERPRSFVESKKYYGPEWRTREAQRSGDDTQAALPPAASDIDDMSEIQI